MPRPPPPPRSCPRRGKRRRRGPRRCTPGLRASPTCASLERQRRFPRLPCSSLSRRQGSSASSRRARRKRLTSSSRACSSSSARALGRGRGRVARTETTRPPTLRWRWRRRQWSWAPCTGWRSSSWCCVRSRRCWPRGGEAPFPCSPSALSATPLAPREMSRGAGEKARGPAQRARGRAPLPPPRVARRPSPDRRLVMELSQMARMRRGRAGVALPVPPPSAGRARPWTSACAPQPPRDSPQTRGRGPQTRRTWKRRRRRRREGPLTRRTKTKTRRTCSPSSSPVRALSLERAPPLRTLAQGAQGTSWLRRMRTPCSPWPRKWTTPHPSRASAPTAWCPSPRPSEAPRRCSRPATLTRGSRGHLPHTCCRPPCPCAASTCSASATTGSARGSTRETTCAPSPQRPRWRRRRSGRPRPWRAGWPRRSGRPLLSLCGSASGAGLTTERGRRRCSGRAFTWPGRHALARAWRWRAW
mmetsp:Transcript_22649/g.70958  ORF Transcript_22649/g.70958 Transcript_22649/m.70958 type:complete len:473 (+) Transcript_22649:207-1625(+)